MLPCPKMLLARSIYAIAIRTLDTFRISRLEIKYFQQLGVKCQYSEKTDGHQLFYYVGRRYGHNLIDSSIIL